MKSIHHPKLLAEIEAFLSETGMGPKYFGKASVGNSEVVNRLLKGGRVWPETEAGLVDFMARRSSQKDGATAVDSAVNKPPVIDGDQRVAK